MRLSPFLLILPLLAGCELNDFRRVPIVAGDDFATELNVNLDQMHETPTGLRYQDLEKGTGAEATAGRSVAVHYTGWLADGREFDSSVGGEPLVFPLGRGAVIDGWDEGVAGMRVGGKRKLVIPPALAYGAQRNGPIPANSTLVFDVELLEVR
ncbi:MAG TPA: FKBP-type peptidyl-prolyl cis-trans isomerase [Gemmatimonadales bacterium]